MVNSIVAVIIPSISTPFLILLFRQASRSFPHEIIEAARIDGVSEFGIFARIYVPTMRSTFAAAAVITFMMAWNNFLWPRVILVNNEVQTMPMLISNLSAGYVTDYGVLMLAVLLASLPTMIIFLAPAALLRRRHHRSHQVTFDPTRLSDPRYFAENRRPAHSDHRWFREHDEAGRRGQRLRAVTERTVEVPLRAATSPTSSRDSSSPTSTPTLGRHPCAGAHPAARLRPPAVRQRAVPLGRARAARARADPAALQPGRLLRPRLHARPPAEPGERIGVVFQGAESAIALWLQRHVHRLRDRQLHAVGVRSHRRSGAGGERARRSGVQVDAAARGWRTRTSSGSPASSGTSSSLRRPAVHVEDLRVTTDSRTTWRRRGARSRSTPRRGTVERGARRRRELAVAEDGILASACGPAAVEPRGPAPVRAHHPGATRDGSLAEVIGQQVGVRRFAIEDGVLRLNGRRIVFFGVNRHEFGLQGRVMTREQTEDDLRL